MEREIQELMKQTGMDRMQAYYHVKGRRWLARNYRQPLAGG